MSLEALGNLGDLLGGIGVIVTVIYLAIQIRQNTEQLRSNAAHAQNLAQEEVGRLMSPWMSQIIADKELAALWRRGLAGDSTLDEVDQLRFEMLFMQLVQAYQSVFRRARRTNDRNQWELMHGYIRMYRRQQGFAECWSRGKGAYDPDFVAEFDRIAGIEAER